MKIPVQFWALAVTAPRLKCLFIEKISFARKKRTDEKLSEISSANDSDHNNYKNPKLGVNFMDLEKSSKSCDLEVRMRETPPFLGR